MGCRTTAQDSSLHILTVNVNGLKTNGDKLLIELQKLESESMAVDVLLLTETHIGENMTDRDALKTFEEDWKIFSTCYHFKSKGAAILVNKKRDFRCDPEIVDPSGRYVILNCCISGTLCTFVSVYHHSKERGLLKELSEKIKKLKTDILVVGGDFNTALDEEKDKWSLHYNYDHNKIREELLPFMNKHDLIDAWREKHPTKTEYTYKVATCEVSRLDYFFINADKWELVKDCRIMKLKISNHWPVSLKLDLKNLQILSSTLSDLPGYEDLAKLCPDIILLAKGKAKDKDYIEKLKEEEREEKRWNVLWSEHSNAAILVAESQKYIHIVSTAYHKNYVILHCIALGMLHTFVSACHPTKENLQNMSREVMHNRSRRIVIGGDFSTSDQAIMDFMKANKFIIPGSMQLPYLIHDTLKGASKFKEEELDRSYYLLILHLPKMKTEDVSNIIKSLGKLKIHH